MVNFKASIARAIVNRAKECGGGGLGGGREMIVRKQRGESSMVGGRGGVVYVA